MESIFISYANSSLKDDPQNFCQILEDISVYDFDSSTSEWASPIPHSEDPGIIEHPDAQTILSEVIAEINKVKP